MPVVNARGSPEVGEEEAGAGVEAEAEKDRTVETEEEAADDGTGAA